jgi:predicted SnoaL-like aldol condensation-catalyzing enzyme
MKRSAEGEAILLSGLLHNYLSSMVNSRELERAPDIYGPDYRLHCDGRIVAGRADYLAMLTEYFASEPTLRVSVNDLIMTASHVAAVLTKSTSAPEPTSWEAIAIWRFEGGAVAEAWTEQDWLGRREPSRETLPELPWDADAWIGAFADSNDQVDASARAWLGSGAQLGLSAVIDGAPALQWPVLAPDEVVVNKLISAGSRFAFHATLTGPYAGGLGSEEHLGERCRLDVAGIGGTDAAGQVNSVRISSDRLGLLRRMKAAGPARTLTSDGTRV